MRLFLTGSTGFIGSHVLAAALKAGHQVRALRRSPSSIPVIPLPSEPEWCEGDLSSLRATDLEGVEAVLHLASEGVSPKPASWDELMQVNVLGSLRLLERASEAAVHRFVVAGSCHEYGNAARRYSKIPPDAPLEPQSPYGASKASAFQIIRTFCVKERLELFYGRIFSAYGEGQFEGNFWPSLSRAARNGHDFPMTSGEQVSDFIPVGDVASHLLKACVRPDLAPGHPLVVNVGSGIGVRLRTFAQKEWVRLEATGRLRLNLLPDRPDQIERYVPDLVGLRLPPSPLP